MLVSFLFAYFGFAALSLTKSRHYQQVWPQQSPSANAVRQLRIVGWLFLTIATVYLVYVRGIGLGLTDLFAVLSLAALLLILQFSYAPRSVAGVGLVNIILGRPSPSAPTSHLQPED